MNFSEAIEKHQAAFGFRFQSKETAVFAVYYDLIQKWNARLHLVAPCAAEEFAVRHFLESLAILEFLPENAQLTDVGTGAGLPAVPCLLARPDLRANLIESNTKKAVFLRQALTQLNLQPRAAVLNSRFEQTPMPENFVTSRALDKFTEKLPEIVDWAKNAEKLLFFGGEKVRDKLSELRLDFGAKLVPLSERRYVFIVNRRQHL